MNEQNRSEYKIIFEKTRSIINKYDPSCLEPGHLGSNTPDDEYDSEVARIVAYFVNHQEEVKLKPALLVEEISRIWQEYFEENCKYAEKIANEIIKSCS